MTKALAIPFATITISRIYINKHMMCDVLFHSLSSGLFSFISLSFLFLCVCVRACLSVCLSLSLSLFSLRAYVCVCLSDYLSACLTLFLQSSPLFLRSLVCFPLSPLLTLHFPHFLLLTISPFKPILLGRERYERKQRKKWTTGKKQGQKSGHIEREGVEIWV